MGVGALKIALRDPNARPQLQYMYIHISGRVEVF